MKIGKSRAKVTRRFTLGFSLAILAILAFGGVRAWAPIPVRSFEEVRKGHTPSDLWIVDRNGTPLESVRTSATNRSLAWVSWQEVSPAFQDLLVRVEDRRFYSHPGVDPLAIAKATWERLAGNSHRGASTLTMQLAMLLSHETFSSRRNIWQKLHQATAALKLNMYWTKEQVLEAYVNLVPFRGELIGLRAASLGYFGKSPSGLMREEAALLIALLRAPNAPLERVAARACSILALSSCEPIQILAEQKFSTPYGLTRARELIPVLSKNFQSGSSNSSIIQTTLDHRIQLLAINALREQLRALRNQNVTDGAVLVLETQTGRVAAYAANAGAGVASAEQIDGIQSRRQAGSTLKPFVYATDFEWRLLSPTSLLDDSPADIAAGPGGVYRPRNYDEVFRGLVSAADALGSSMNVPAVKAIQLVGEARVLEQLRSAGFTHLQDDEYYGPSLALGTIDVTLWELTQGYRRLAIHSTVFSEPTRNSIFNILASPEHRRFTFGMDSILSLPFPAAVKTGTSKDMRDNWCIGWTPEYTVGVWVGNFNGEPMWNVSGMTGAAPIWRSLMLALHPNPNFNPKATNISYEQPAQHLLQEPAQPLPRHTISRIRYPVPDMLVGLDPDIPTPLQQIPIEVENPQPHHRLYLNHRLLNKARPTTFWPLQRGKFLVELKDPKGEIVDSLKFEVR